MMKKRRIQESKEAAGQEKMPRSKEAAGENITASSINADVSRIVSITSNRKSEALKIPQVAQIPLQYEAPASKPEIKAFESEDSNSPESFGLAAAFAIAMLAGKKTETFLSRIYSTPEPCALRSNNPAIDVVSSLEDKIDIYNMDIQHSKRELDDAARSICRIEAIVQKMNLK